MNSPIDLVQFQHCLPVLALLCGAFFVPLIGLMLSEKAQRLFSLLSLAGFSAIAIAFALMDANSPLIFDSMVYVDWIASSATLIACVLLFLSSSIFFGRASYSQDMAHHKINEQPTLIASLLLLSCVGVLLMVSSNHLLLVFIGLEILSIPLYVLTCLQRQNVQSSEASFKYFILGAIASALFVYGMALLWGETGTLLISELSLKIFGAEKLSDLTVFGFALLMVSMFFKLGLAPFHMWVPDVYQSAPAALTGWMSGAVKLAAAIVILRFADVASHGAFEHKWMMAVKVFAMISMMWGSLGALFQKKLKRMLAYSSVSHAGFIAMGFVNAFQVGLENAAPAIIYYLLTYGLAGLLCFAVILNFESENGDISTDDLKGLYARYPASSIALFVALLSLAGLPPLAGFFAKYQFFVLSLQSGHFGLVLVAMLATLISLAYYLKLIMNALMTEPASEPTKDQKKLQLSACLAAAAILVLGILPWEAISFVTTYWK